MAKKYLDQNGLSYLWGKLKVVFNGKADKVDGATNGNFAGLDANGNLVDSGKKAADFKAVQTAVSRLTRRTSVLLPPPKAVSCLLTTR